MYLIGSGKYLMHLGTIEDEPVRCCAVLRPWNCTCDVLTVPHPHPNRRLQQPRLLNGIFLSLFLLFLPHSLSTCHVPEWMLGLQSIDKTWFLPSWNTQSSQRQKRKQSPWTNMVREGQKMGDHCWLSILEAWEELMIFLESRESQGGLTRLALLSYGEVAIDEQRQT